MSSLMDLYDDTYDPGMSTERPDYSPVPAGEYMVQITAAERVDKPTGDVMVKLTVEIAQGEYEGRKIWENLNLRHANPKAQEIAQRTFTELWRDALLLPRPPASLADIEFKPMRAKIGVEKRKDTGEMQNRVKQFMALQQGGAPAPVAARPASAVAPQRGEDRRPSFLKPR